MANPGRRKRSIEILSMLLEKADVQGYLTTEDLFEIDPDVSRDAERRETFLTLLRRQGIEILDQEPGADLYIEEEADDLLDDDCGDTLANLDPISTEDTIGLYLKEMSRVPLLNMEEEQDLADVS